MSGQTARPSGSEPHALSSGKSGDVLTEAAVERADAALFSADGRRCAEEPMRGGFYGHGGFLKRFAHEREQCARFVLAIVRLTPTSPGAQREPAQDICAGRPRSGAPVSDSGRCRRGGNRECLWRMLRQQQSDLFPPLRRGAGTLARLYAALRGLEKARPFRCGRFGVLSFPAIPQSRNAGLRAQGSGVCASAAGTQGRNLQFPGPEHQCGSAVQPGRRLRRR